MYVDAVVGIKCIMVERDEMNRGTSSLPPVLSKELLGFTRAQFGDLLLLINTYLTTDCKKQKFVTLKYYDGLSDLQSST